MCTGAADAPAWELDARGQIDGIGTSPRFTAKQGDGGGVIDQRGAQRGGARRPPRRSSTSPDGSASHYGGARVLGVGHRVVHGGAALHAPGAGDAGGARRPAGAGAARPAAPAAQSRGDRGGVRAAARACRRSRASTPASIAASRRWLSSCRCRATSARVASSATASTDCRTSTSRRSLPEAAPEIAAGRVIVAHLGSGASLCALENGKSIDSTLGFTALDGLCMGTRPGALDPGVVLYLFQVAGQIAGGGRDDPLQEVRTAGHFGHQQRHARPARQPGA